MPASHRLWRDGCGTVKILNLTSIAPPEWRENARLGCPNPVGCLDARYDHPSAFTAAAGAWLAAWLAARAAGSRAARMEAPKCAIRGAAAALGRLPAPIGASRLPLQPCSMNTLLIGSLSPRES